MRYFAPLWAIALIAMAGCSASIPVTKIEKDKDTVDHEGTLLVLPRTQLSLSYNVVTTTFSVGRWTDEIEECEDLLDFKPTQSEAERRDFLAKRTTPLSCVLAYEYGLRSRRLSRAEDHLTCLADGDSKRDVYPDGRENPKGSPQTNPDGDLRTEVRTTIDPTSLAVTGKAIPDPSHMYWVSTPAKWFGDADVTVKYTEAGTVSGAKSVATNPWSDFAVTLTGMAIKSVLPVVGAGMAPSDSLTSSRKQCLFLSNDAIGLDKKELTPCQQFLSDLAVLTEAAGDRAKGILNIDGPSFEKQLALLDADILEKRAQFEGRVVEKPKARTLAWIPLPIGSTDAPKACRADEKPEEGSAWRCRKELSEPVPACVAETEGGTAPTYPGYVVSASAWVTPEGKATLDSFQKTIGATDSGFGRANDDRGFPYRVLVESKVSAGVSLCKTSAKDCKDDGKMKEAAMAVAQYGSIGRLTPRAGGRKATIDVSYFAETGALTSVQVAGEGSDPKAITDALQSRLTPAASPSDLDVLKAEKDRIEAMSVICASYDELAGDPPTYCAE